MMKLRRSSTTESSRPAFFVPTLWGGAAVLSLSAVYFSVPLLLPATYVAPGDSVATSTPEAPREERPIAAHLPTPTPVRAAYMSQCAATTDSFRQHFKKLFDETELNSVVIDIKDYTGTLAFQSGHPLLAENGGGGCRVADLRDYIEALHRDGIYVIGRITVFQDPFYTSAHPELAVQSKSRPGEPWKDRKGLSFVDVGARPFWDYIVAIGKESYVLGIDELNFDYIRYPSDGNMRDVSYAHSDGDDKATELERFFAYLHDELDDSGAVLSADLFGMTATNVDDLNIGQVLERALPYFDYIAPMVYPSHYPSGFNGWQNVNAVPYEIIKFSMDRAVERALATSTPVAFMGAERIGTSTPAMYEKERYDPSKLRPWIQDFDYPVTYTADMVRAQIQATYDAGLDSWMLWDPANKYTPAALATSTQAR